jgi:hypothetical protein
MNETSLGDFSHLCDLGFNARQYLTVAGANLFTGTVVVIFKSRYTFQYLLLVFSYELPLLHP